MPDVTGFSETLAEAHEGFAQPTFAASLGPTVAERFADSMTAGRMVPGYGRMADPQMDSLRWWQARGPRLWPAWEGRGRAGVAELADAGPSGIGRGTKPSLPAATAAIDQALAIPGPRPAVLRDRGGVGARATGLLDVAGFVRDVRTYLATSPTDGGDTDTSEASPLWRSLGLSVAALGGRLEHSGGRPTLMRLPDVGRELVAATASDDVIGDLERHALGLARAEGGAPSPTPEVADADTPRYFALDGVAVDVARRFVRSPQGRRMTDTLLRGGPRVHTPEAPRITDWALRAAAQAPRGAIPAAGAGGAADVVAGVDYQLLNAMDQWESAFPGRAPYVTPRERGEGNESPDFKDVAPELPRWDVQAAAAAGSASTGGPVDVKAAQILQEMGLLGSGGVASVGPRGAVEDGPGAWGFREGVLEQGSERALSMALVAPVLQVVRQDSAPLLKEQADGDPGSGISTAEKGVEEADSEKIDYAADQIFQRLRMMIQTEKDRRGY